MSPSVRKAPRVPGGINLGDFLHAEYLHVEPRRLLHVLGRGLLRVETLFGREVADETARYIDYRRAGREAISAA
jgi:hypothetical protein